MATIGILTMAPNLKAVDRSKFRQSHMGEMYSSERLVTQFYIQ